jgi:hypothetical protein
VNIFGGAFFFGESTPPFLEPFNKTHGLTSKLSPALQPNPVQVEVATGE